MFVYNFAGRGANHKQWQTVGKRKRNYRKGLVVNCYINGKVCSSAKQISTKYRAEVYVPRTLAMIFLL